MTVLLPGNRSGVKKLVVAAGTKVLQPFITLSLNEHKFFDTNITFYMRKIFCGKTNS